MFMYLDILKTFENRPLAIIRNVVTAVQRFKSRVYADYSMKIDHKMILFQISVSAMDRFEISDVTF